MEVQRGRQDRLRTAGSSRWRAKRRRPNLHHLHCQVSGQWDLLMKEIKLNDLLIIESPKTPARTRWRTTWDRCRRWLAICETWPSTWARKLAPRITNLIVSTRRYVTLLLNTILSNKHFPFRRNQTRTASRGPTSEPRSCSSKKTKGRKATLYSPVVRKSSHQAPRNFKSPKTTDIVAPLSSGKPPLPTSFVSHSFRVFASTVQPQTVHTFPKFFFQPTWPDKPIKAQWSIGERKDVAQSSANWAHRANYSASLRHLWLKPFISIHSSYFFPLSLPCLTL